MEIQLQQFQAQSLQLIEQLKQTGEEISLTEIGQAIAKVVAISPQKQVHLLAICKAVSSFMVILWSRLMKVGKCANHEPKSAFTGYSYLDLGH